MEITILDSVKLPEKPVLTVRVGSVRRQAKLEVSQPFVIPHPGTTSCDVEVAVYEQLATHSLSGDKIETDCIIPVQQLNGASSLVKLNVKRRLAATLSDDKVNNALDDIGMTREYLERHKLQQHIQSLIQDVLRDQPTEPYKHMIAQLKDVQRERRGEPVARPQKLPPITVPRPAKAEPPSPEPSKSATSPSQPAPAPVESAQPLAPATTGKDEKSAAAAPVEARPLEPKPPTSPKPPGDSGTYGGRKLKPTAPEGGDNSTVERGKQRMVTTEFDDTITIARQILRMVMRSPPCLQVAAEVFRQAERRKMTEMICGNVFANAYDKVVKKAELEASPRHQAKALLRLSLTGAAVLCSSEYKQSVVKMSCSFIFRSAFNVISKQDEWAEECICAIEGHEYLPTPFVKLTSEGSWGQWLK